MQRAAEEEADRCVCVCVWVCVCVCVCVCVKTARVAEFICFTTALLIQKVQSNGAARGGGGGGEVFVWQDRASC